MCLVSKKIKRKEDRRDGISIIKHKNKLEKMNDVF